MNEEEFKRRTKEEITLRVIRVVEALPKTRTAEVIGRQRSATSRKRRTNGASSGHTSNRTRPYDDGAHPDGSTRTSPPRPKM
jgi:hypothetical protein